MILERLSRETRHEIESLSYEERRALATEITGDLPDDLDPVVREFLERIQKGPLIDPTADPVALVRGGRRD